MATLERRYLMFLIATGRAFHSRGPATEKALSPNFVSVRGMPNSFGVRRSEPPAAARKRRNSSSRICDVRWTGAVADSVYITRQSLQRIRGPSTLECVVVAQHTTLTIGSERSVLTIKYYTRRQHPASTIPAGK